MDIRMDVINVMNIRKASSLMCTVWIFMIPTDGASNHQPHHCLLNRLFGRSSKKTSQLRVTGLCVCVMGGGGGGGGGGNSPGTPVNSPASNEEKFLELWLNP